MCTRVALTSVETVYRPILNQNRRWDAFTNQMICDKALCDPCWGSLPSIASSLDPLFVTLTQSAGCSSESCPASFSLVF